MAYLGIVRCVKTGEGSSTAGMDKCGWNGGLGPVYKSQRQRGANKSKQEDDRVRTLFIRTKEAVLMIDGETKRVQQASQATI